MRREWESLVINNKVKARIVLGRSSDFFYYSLNRYTSSNNLDSAVVHASFWVCVYIAFFTGSIWCPCFSLLFQEWPLGQIRWDIPVCMFSFCILNKKCYQRDWIKDTKFITDKIGPLFIDFKGIFVYFNEWVSVDEMKRSS